MDLDFEGGRRSFKEMVGQISGFYLKKRVDYFKAVEKVRTIVERHVELKSIFWDLPDTNHSESSGPLSEAVSSS